MIKTIKYGLILWVLVTAWSNMDEPSLFFYLMIFGGCVSMTFYLFVRLIMYIDDVFSTGESDFRIYK